MIILAIETSCDDTCVAILEIQNLKINLETKIPSKILSNVISSQVKLHAKYGGVYPSLAKREHQKNLPLVLQKALKGAKLLLGKIDLIAVTVGPGLEPCLWTGINFAKELAEKLNLPIVPVNHIEAHIAANFIGENPKFERSPTGRQGGGRVGVLNPKLFPAICLVVSGGHTQLILMKKIGIYKILGETRDDAAGECFDKVARILGLGYPGGPAIAAEAAKFKISNLKPSTRAKLGAGLVPHRNEVSGAGFKIILPRPMIYQKNYDFSFSGLKTAVLYLVKKNFYKNNQLTISNQQLAIISHEVQQAIIDVLIHKTLRAAKEHKVKTIILGGGVAANEELRKQFKSIVKCQMSNVKFLVPPENFCTDNAAMAAAAAYYSRLRRKTKTWKKIKADANLRLS